MVTGGIYAIAASTSVITYRSSGILNFAYGAEAYFIARLYYYLHVVHGWGIVPSAVLCLAVVSPLLGLFLWAVVFRILQRCQTIVKIACTIGLSVALTALAAVLFGDEPVGLAPGLAPTPVAVYKVFGAAVTLNQAIVLGAVLVITVGGWALLRFTDSGLVLRAIVSSEALTSASGTNPRMTSIGVWVVTTVLAGVSGVLVAPVIGPAASGFTLLMAAAFAAVVAARLQSIGIAAAVGILLGVIASVVQAYLPSDGLWATATADSIPFAVALVALIYHMSRGQARESGTMGGPFDRAIAVQELPANAQMPVAGDGEPQNARGSEASSTTSTRSAALRKPLAFVPLDTRGLWAVVALVVVCSLVLDPYWIGLIAAGLALSTALLSYTVVTGEGGILSLSQITLAGVGAVTTAQLATNYHWPILLAVLCGGIIAVPIGIVLALVTARLGDLYIVLVTLMFGVLVDNLVFTQNVFSNYQAGVVAPRPGFLLDDRAFLYLALLVFVGLALLVRNLRRSTAGLALGAVRSSEVGSLSLGISVVTMKALAMGSGAFVAGISGGMIALGEGVANPVQFVTTIGLTWVAVIVSLGLRSLVAAAVGGVTFAIMPAVFAIYFPPSVVQIPTVLFGVAAVLVARNPEGVIVQNARQLRDLGRRIASKVERHEPVVSGVVDPDVRIPAKEASR
ncbi:ABC transporter permease [Streptomyces sp. NPDC029041]|uniref:branched-chain amino acid ABC transporter permease n=1 Tax=Streptomyces sp. NPDC029041 TaxID=3155727 RepID=UPI0033EA0437